MDLAVRPARVADLAAIVALERACFGADGLPVLVVRQYLDLFEELTLVVGPPDSLHGVIYGGLTAGAPREAWILGVAVAPDQRRRGLADRLLGALLPRLDAAGGPPVLATVRPDNAASRALFARHGFVETSTDPEYFGPGQARLRLRRDGAA